MSTARLWSLLVKAKHARHAECTHAYVKARTSVTLRLRLRGLPYLGEYSLTGSLNASSSRSRLSSSRRLGRMRAAGVDIRNVVEACFAPAALRRSPDRLECQVGARAYASTPSPVPLAARA